MKKSNRLFLGAVALVAASAFSLTGTAAHASTIYLASSSKWDTGKALSVHPNGHVYNADGKLVGHLTDPNGKSIKEIPGSGDYEIQTRSGKILASSNASTPGIDGSRSIQIDEGGQESGTAGAVSSPTNTNPGTAPTGNAGADAPRVPAPANTGATTTSPAPAQ